MVGEYIPTDRTDEAELQAGLADFNQYDVLPILEDVWLNPNNDDMIITVVQQQTGQWGDELGDWEEIYNQVYSGVDGGVY